MVRKHLQKLAVIAVATILLIGIIKQPVTAEKRNLVTHPNTPYQLSFYKRHRRSYRVAGALHFAHSKLHDVLLLTPFSNNQQEDTKLYNEVLNFIEF